MILDHRKQVVVIPAFNEERKISAVLRGVKQSVPWADIVVVNDGSRDQTARIATEEGALVINHPFNMGYGIALQTGYKYAARKNYKVILQIDADGQHDSEYLKVISKIIEDGEADVVLGSRFHDGSQYRAPFFRRIGMWIFNKIVLVVSGQRVTDSTSGYQGFNEKVLRFYTSDLYPWDYPDADVLLMLHYARFRLKEISVRMYPSDGKSMHSGVLKPIYYVFKMTLSILVTILRGRKISRHFSMVTE